MNPPTIQIWHLPIHTQQKLILLALEVVELLALERDWDAYSRLELAHLEEEELLGWWTLLSSSQRATIKSLSEAAHARR